ncbi:hypothetical protein [Cellulosimicrobium sp. SH8]|uniref:hypothetical protein n=1 Tax=Cellulosimicrobium sp. SH8 TaxID=2952936 RepID=UPI0021F2E120|nr:hypothetical protein [Cellulosimicrobium sp. SH8]
MVQTAEERYREHSVWEILKLKREALESSRFSTNELERDRQAVASLLETAEASQRNARAHLYDDLLDELANWVNGLAADESSFAQHIYRFGTPSTLATLVRQLPGPPPRNLPASYMSVLETAATLRQEELAALKAEVTKLRGQLSIASTALEKSQSAAQSARDSARSAADAAGQSADRLENELRGEWSNRLEAWELARLERDEAADASAAEHLRMLGHAARLGDRLLENATASLVAKDWGQRSTRERRAGWLTRLSGLVALAGAAIVGGLIVSRALEDGFDLTLGDGILRASLVLAIAGIGAALLAESRRHFREADSSEEIQLALTAIEPFFASDSSQREAARKALGDAVFVRNVLSRFSHRDAAKHAGVSEVTVSSVVDDLTKTVDSVTKASSVK